jgi:Putative auto-transporter adhesin, head GIN domain
MSKSSILGMATLATLAALLLAGCCISLPQTVSQTIVGSGKQVTVEKDLSGFSRVTASSAFRVDISQADGYSVAITVDEKVVPYLDVAVQGDTLRIALRSGLSLSGAMAPMDAKVTMPKLTGLDLSGATQTKITGFKSGENLDANASGASQLTGDIEAGSVRFGISGASRMTLQGKGQSMNLEASGASQANLEEFQVGNANVQVSGASRATVNATGRLDADVSGASTLRYAGNPTMGSIKSSGASTIQPK